MVAIISGLLSAGCSVFGIRNEHTPSYTVERTIGPAEARVEVRRYGARLAAETTVLGGEADARSKGFRILARYIFGANATKTPIDMTAPVAQTKARAGQSIDMTAPVGQSRTTDGKWRIRFFMPDDYTLNTLPRPNDPAIDIVTISPERVAVLRYSGTIGTNAVHDAERRLMQIIAGELEPSGEPFTWFYDPPWTLPPLRRNEAAVLIQSG